MRIATTCGAIIRNETGEILVLLRSKTDDKRPVRWDLPGGHAEVDETVEEALARELLEETGLELKTKPQLLYTNSDAEMFPDVSVNWLFFAVTVQDGEITLSHEHSEYQWVDIEKAIELIDYLPKKSALEYIAKYELI